MEEGKADRLMAQSCIGIIVGMTNPITKKITDTGPDYVQWILKILIYIHMTTMGCLEKEMMLYMPTHTDLHTHVTTQDFL